MPVNKLGMLMEQHEKTIEEVAVCVGKTSTTVKNWKLQKNQPNAIDMVALFTMFGLRRLDEFIT